MQKDFKRILQSGLVLSLVLAAILSVNPNPQPNLASAASVETSNLAALSAAPLESANLPSTATLSCTVTTTTPNGCDLYATTGSLSLPGLATPVTIWGYAASPGVSATIPGPTIIATKGDKIKITLHNALSQASSLGFPAMPIPPDMVGAATNLTKTYAFVANQPGTSLYEAGMTPNSKVQVTMGMFGALIVRPTNPNQAYDSPATWSPAFTTTTFSSIFTDEAVLIFSELDPALNASPTTYDLHNYSPKYWLINGKAYPQTGVISTTAGSNLLLRYLNAGLTNQSVGTMGLHSWVVGLDGKPMPHPYQMTAETLPAGESLDVLTTIPATAALNTKYALYNAGNHLDNSGALAGTAATSPIKYGGMLTFITTVSSTAVISNPPVTGPAVSSVQLTPNVYAGTGTVLVNATIASPARAAQYSVDGSPAVTMTGSGTSFSATIPTTALTPLSNGNHTVSVSAAISGTGNTLVWGSPTNAILTVNRATAPVGPVITGTLSPNPTNGQIIVTINATADSTTTSNLPVVAAEYFFNRASPPPTTTRGTALTIGPAGQLPITSFSANVPTTTLSALATGNYTVTVRAQDSNGTWGALANIRLTLDKAGPQTGSVKALPSPNNGTIMLNPNTPFKVSAVITDPVVNGVTSGVVAAEAFIDNSPSNNALVLNGSGHVLMPDPSVTNGYYYTIALSDISQLGQGLHTAFVHGQDGAGNWGTVISTTFIVDKTAPTLTALTGANSGTTGISFAITATDQANTAIAPATVNAPASNIVAAEYFEGTDPGAGNGRAMTLPTSYVPSPNMTNVTITVTGFTRRTNHTVWVRVKDAAGNWSLARSVRVTIR
jgi:FtsP/CotA-like multicopper oxidase with cupredoxin domain